MHLRHTHTDKLVICTLSRHACTVYLLLVSCSLLVQDSSTVAMAPSFSLSLAMPAGAAISPAASAIIAYRNVAGSSSTVSSQLGRFSSSEIFAVKLVAAPSRRLCCFSVLDNSSARGRVAVCKVCFLDLTQAYYVDRHRRCDLVLLWSTVCRLSFDLCWWTRFFYRENFSLEGILEVKCLQQLFVMIFGSNWKCFSWWHSNVADQCSTSPAFGLDIAFSSFITVEFVWKDRRPYLLSVVFILQHKILEDGLNTVGLRVIAL